jgi:hypothetical protein
MALPKSSIEANLEAFLTQLRRETRPPRRQCPPTKPAFQLAAIPLPGPPAPERQSQAAPRPVSAFSIQPSAFFLSSHIRPPKVRLKSAERISKRRRLRHRLLTQSF